MSGNHTTDLKLPRLPKTDTVRLTLTLPAALHERLEAYAALYARTYGEQVDIKRLIPAILDRFLTTDRAFARKARGRSGPAEADGSSGSAVGAAAAGSGSVIPPGQDQAR
jgi:hypothetical protein